MSRSSRERGFSLVEAMVTLVIVGLVLVGAISAAAADLRASRKSIAVAEASALAEDLLFRTPFLRWDSLTGFGTQREGRFPAPMDRYSWRIDTEPSVQEPGLVEATATVAWNGGEVTASTRFGPSPLSQAAGAP